MIKNIYLIEFVSFVFILKFYNFIIWYYISIIAISLPYRYTWFIQTISLNIYMMSKLWNLKWKCFITFLHQILSLANLYTLLFYFCWLRRRGPDCTQFDLTWFWSSTFKRICSKPSAAPSDSPAAGGFSSPTSCLLHSSSWPCWRRRGAAGSSSF